MTSSISVTLQQRLGGHQLHAVNDDRWRRNERQRMRAEHSEQAPAPSFRSSQAAIDAALERQAAAALSASRPLTAGDIKQNLKSDVERKSVCLVSLRDIRGTKPYSMHTRKDLSSVASLLSSSTFLLALSADELGWSACLATATGKSIEDDVRTHATTVRYWPSDCSESGVVFDAHSMY
jgi:hypothetical protein